MEKLYDMFDRFVHSDWLATALGVVLILGVTAVLSRAAITLTRKMLRRGSLLPTSSIFVNVIRVGIWLVGISFMLSTCFNVDVSAIVTGLGVGGIAVSLGFQDTISNLIGGLQVSVSRTVEPGDNIKLGVSGVSGVVRDVTWRYTTVDNPAGTRIVIPNSLMNTTALIKLAGPENVTVPLVVTDSEQRLTAVAHHMEEAAAKALKRVDKVKKGPSVSFSEVTAQGFKGSLSFTLADVSKVSAPSPPTVTRIPSSRCSAPSRARCSRNRACRRRRPRPRCPPTSRPPRSCPRLTRLIPMSPRRPRRPMLPTSKLIFTQI